MGSLAVKYRPTTLSEVCGQEFTVKILDRQLLIGEFKNAYLFHGASGCGKTTVARILANAINKNSGHPIEIDAASNSGVDKVRTIVKEAYERSLDSVYKIYIIDEVHALSSSAWQALLKCIEEPPKYTIFILCTTEVHKVPDTIINRVMQFSFSKIPAEIISERLKYICNVEHYTNFNESCDYISRICKGGMRDAISLLEKCASLNPYFDINTTVALLGGFSYDMLFSLINSFIDGNEANVINIVDQLYMRGTELSLFINELIKFCLDIFKYVIFKDIRSTSIPASYEDELNRVSMFDNVTNYYSYVLDRLMSLQQEIKSDIDIKSTVEIRLILIARCQ